QEPVADPQPRERVLPRSRQVPAAELTKRRLLGVDDVGSQERPQHRWHSHASVLILILLADRDERTTHGETRTIESVHVTRLFFRSGAVADLSSSRLEVGKTRAAGNLTVALLRRQPNFQIVSAH